MADSIKALRAAGLTIKPLVWLDPMEHTDDEGVTFEAAAFSVRDFYRIRHLGGGRCALDLYEGGWIGYEHSLDGAKAAAQADFDKRVAAALISIPKRHDNKES